MILQLLYYSVAQNLICLHLINLNSKASSFSNSSCHFYTMLNTARNLNIMTGHMRHKARTLSCVIQPFVSISSSGVGNIGETYFSLYSIFIGHEDFHC